MFAGVASTLTSHTYSQSSSQDPGHSSSQQTAASDERHQPTARAVGSNDSGDGQVTATKTLPLLCKRDGSDWQTGSDLAGLPADNQGLEQVQTEGMCS